MSFITGRAAVVVACSRSEPALFGARIFTTASSFFFCPWTRVLRPDTDADADADADPDADPDASPSPPLPPLRPCSLGNKPSEGGARGPITTCPDLTAIRGLGISYALPHETRNSRALLFGQRIALKSCETRAVPSLPSPNLTAIVIPPSLSTRFYFLLFFFFSPPTSSHHLSSDDDSVEWEASNSW